MLELAQHAEDYQVIEALSGNALPPWPSHLDHALRQRLIPVIPLIGVAGRHFAVGAILTETCSAGPGIGKWFNRIIGRRDYPVVQGGILIVACIIIVVESSRILLTAL